MIPRRARQAGFTLAEVVIAVAVLAILATSVSVPVINYLRLHDIQAEKLAQLQIQQAMAAMLVNEATLPADDGTVSNQTDANYWANKLARYSTLSPSQIRTDTWGNPRRYVMLAYNTTILGNPTTLYYATLLSPGPDRQAYAVKDSSNQLVVPASNPASGYDAAGNSGWWKNRASPVDAFSAVGAPAGDDDIILRFTDYPAKVDAYNTTLTRLSKISQALETYSRQHYAERLALCTSASPPADCATYPPQKQIFYPPTYPDSNGATITYSYPLYDQAVVNEVTAANLGVGYIYNSGAENLYGGNSTPEWARYVNMVNLMRMLGLPDEDCCSPLMHFTNPSGKLQEKPFFYFSNPRVRSTNGTSCGARPGLNDPKLPARLTTTSVADGTSGATCG